MDLCSKSKNEVPCPSNAGISSGPGSAVFHTFTRRADSHAPFVNLLVSFGRYECEQLGGPPKNATNPTKRMTDLPPRKPEGGPTARNAKKGRKASITFSQRKAVGRGARETVRNAHTTKSYTCSRRRRNPMEGECPLARSFPGHRLGFSLFRNLRPGVPCSFLRS